jgi:hypothetical protein
VAGVSFERAAEGSMAYRFEILDGSHVVSNDPLQVATQGDIVESEVNLAEKFGENKFKLVGEVQASAKADAKKGGKAE